ncbi:MAG: TAT-variant-translocated molybdopterin oxidoreductase [Bryobacterales bacterium]|nr:TAT-variant-translocated molybdopterin oxidoreductase [Bryobacterales bacterium]
MPEKPWRSLEEWQSVSEPDGREFAEDLTAIEAGPGRRGFLKAAGFSFGAAMLAGCSRTVQKIEPNLVQPEGFIPGLPVYYASTCGACSAACGTLVKVRDGRPIKLEGNSSHPISQGGLCAVGQASILGLYDSRRVAQPVVEGKPASWAQADAFIRSRIDDVRQRGGTVRLLTGTVHGPAESASIRRFLDGFRNARHIAYDALSSSAIPDAHEQTHGLRILPRYRFDKADVIVSIGADFLGTWISPVEFARGYASSRDPQGSRYAWHAQVEPLMSLTGTKADLRVVLGPSETAAFVNDLFEAVRTGASSRAEVAGIAERLRGARGRGLVVCGSQDVATQVLVNRINEALGNYGATVVTDRACRQRRGDDRALQSLFAELRDGRVDVLIVAGTNPVFDIPGGDVVRKAKLLVVHAERLDETAAKADVVSAASHTLESWGDAEPVEGAASLVQPCIRPLFQTRSWLETLAAWSGKPAGALDLLRDHWQREIFPNAKSGLAFEPFWEKALQDGFVEYQPPARAKAAAATPREAAPHRETQRQEGFELVLYAKTALFEGRHAYNPWLQEVPDPVTKVAWDNYCCLAPSAAAKLGAVSGNVVRIECGGQTLELPALVQPGQHEGTLAVALGYGSSLSARFAKAGPEWIEALPTLNEKGLVGVNAAPLLAFEQGTLRYSRSGAKLSKTGKQVALACTQEHHTLSVPERLKPAAGGTRPIVQETTLAQLREGLAQLRENGGRAEDKPKPELWPPDHPYPAHHWAMVVDLNACTGCAACIVACQAENNIPVVGKDEMRRKREMHWMRIDRYYSGAPENPRVAHQPMFCQQCDHAPCETVCPVLATSHSEEGLNQQTYNRCVGTRYCANNCPYKVRRFNWFQYSREDRVANLVLNPEVTVRSRGVMEKCTFCVQRIQEAKIESKRAGIPLGDGDIQTACQQTCPAKAIVFGDLDDTRSEVSRLMASGRRYRVLEEINVRPAVGYLKIVRPELPAGGEKQHG